MINDEVQMEILLKFLITETNSFDSNRDSIQFLKEVGLIGNRYTPLQMMDQIYKAYLILKIRMKIGYEITLRKETF